MTRNMYELGADIMIRDTNGNTLCKLEDSELSYGGFHFTEGHVSDSGTLVITVELVPEVNEDA